MPNTSLKKLYTDELKDLYSAENQLVKALPKMAKAASSEHLRKGFEKHPGADQRARRTPRRSLPFPGGEPERQEMHGHGRFN
jgi:hypothetical protein